MAAVTNNNARKYRYLGLEDEERLKQNKIVTLRDKILKQFLQRQLDIPRSLKDQINKKTFVKASTEESITNCTSGLLSYSEFQSLETKLSITETLSASGLSKSEIKILLDEDGHSCLEAPHVRELRLHEIASKLSRRQELLENCGSKPEQFNGAFPLNKHDFEVECSTLPVTDGADKLTSCLIRLQPHHDETVPADHPINHIKELAQELFPNSITDACKINNSQRKTKASEDISGSSGKKKKTENNKFKYVSEKPKTFWDMQEFPRIVVDKESQNVNGSTIDKGSGIKQIHDISEKKCLVNRTKPFILSLDPADLVPLQEINSSRMTLEEIRNIGKFRTYDEGDPSQTLYIKNLPHKMSQRELAAIFGHFESLQGPKIVYRILDGRMRGQAFVTFQDVAAATKALKTCNGYILHGKPTVIAYGKKQSSEDV
ncbi:RNA-binding protein 41-like [Penaeus chinensis]|uniref:RNA-binding protein 41-like n=1 Tax=Penaeus chinensis TaxID=139456 RepID=UPI001FB5E1E2|nr:RNA-binding protein 41-like [Penaeus chinensis]